MEIIEKLINKSLSFSDTIVKNDFTQTHWSKILIIQCQAFQLHRALNLYVCELRLCSYEIANNLA